MVHTLCTAEYSEARPSPCPHFRTSCRRSCILDTRKALNYLAQRSVCDSELPSNATNASNFEGPSKLPRAPYSPWFDEKRFSGLNVCIKEQAGNQAAGCSEHDTALEAAWIGAN